MSSADRNRKVTAAMGRDTFHQALSEATNELESRVFEMGSLRQIGQLFENMTYKSVIVTRRHQFGRNPPHLAEASVGMSSLALVIDYENAIGSRLQGRFEQILTCLKGDFGLPSLDVGVNLGNLTGDFVGKRHFIALPCPLRTNMFKADYADKCAGHTNRGVQH